jgi:glycosyltransferase involved in cell wall biosynthesis
MKILSITAQKPHSTGSGTYMTELVRAFDRMGHSQAVVCGIFPDDVVEFPDGVSCYPVFFTDKKAYLLAAPCKAAKARFSALPFPVVGMSDIMPYTSTRYRDLTPDMIAQFEAAFIDAVSKAIAELDPDLIICHHLFLLTALVRKHFPDRRIAGISHGTDLRQMINCDNLREIVRPYIKELDAALALHAEQRTQIIEIFGMDESRVSVIGSGYNNKLFNTDGRVEREDGMPLRIAYAGKISRPKGVPEMLAALDRLAADSEVPAFELTMAGGCQDEVMQEKLRELPPWADWLGQIPQPALAELLRRTDIFILPSYFEGLPLVLIEAMACGTRVICSDLPGIQPWLEKAIPGSGVVFVTPPEMQNEDEPLPESLPIFEQALAEAIVTVMEHPLADQNLVKNVSWDALCGKLIGIFKK